MSANALTSAYLRVSARDASTAASSKTRCSSSSRARTASAASNCIRARSRAASSAAYLAACASSASRRRYVSSISCTNRSRSSCILHFASSARRFSSASFSLTAASAIWHWASSYPICYWAWKRISRLCDSAECSSWSFSCTSYNSASLYSHTAYPACVNSITLATAASGDAR